MDKTLKFTKNMEEEVNKTIKKYENLETYTLDFIERQTKEKILEDLRNFLNSKIASKFFVKLFKNMRL